MIEGLVLLLVFQLLGNVAEMYFHLPVPGSVLGMFLLLVALIANDRLASWVRPISLVLISYLAVLFVPAGVGIMLHIDRLKNEALPIGVSLVVSTILTIAVTALVIKYSTIWLQKRKEQHRFSRHRGDLVLAFYLFSFVADRHPGGLPLCSETL